MPAPFLATAPRGAAGADERNPVINKNRIAAATVASTLAGMALLAGGAHLSRSSQTEAYPTRCVLVTLPPNGQPLPKVCVVYPI